MFRRLPDSSSVSASWMLVVFWMLLIYATIPLARRIQEYVGGLFGPHLYLAASAIAGVTFLGIAATYILRKRKKRILRKVGWMAVLGMLATWIMRNQLQSPAEAIHFFQYSVLGFLLFRAWSHYIRDPMIYPVAAFSLAMAAALDEFIQWMTPGRYWDFRDIRLNLMAGIIMQLFIALVIDPSGIRPPVARRSVRWFCRTALVTLVAMGFAISNTPARVDLYATRIPFLRFLYNNQSVMTEFGHRHVDPDIGTFFSRFTIPELRAIDAARGEEAGNFVREYSMWADYEEFLKTITSSADPFLHEFRVHLYRRDHYDQVCWKYQESDPPRFTHHITVALREDQILERYFPRTLEASGNRWANDKRISMDPFAGDDPEYVSEVSDHLVTRATERELHVFLGLLAAIILWIFYRYGRTLPTSTT